MPSLRQNLSTIMECTRECVRAIPLAQHVILFTIALLTVIYAGNTLILTHYYSMFSESERESRDARAGLLAEHAGRTLYAIDLSLGTIADSLKSNLPLEKPTIVTQLLLDKYIKSLPAVRAINVANADGLQVNSSRSFPPLPINEADRLYFSEQKQLRGVGLYLDRIEVSRADNKPFFAMSRPILDNDGNFGGLSRPSPILRILLISTDHAVINRAKSPYSNAPTASSWLVRVYLIRNSWTVIPKS